MKTRIVVTGMGVVSPLGMGVDAFWTGLKEEKCGIDTITLFDADQCDCRIAAEAHEFEPEKWMNRRTIQRTARFTQLAMVAAKEAWSQAGMPESPDAFDENLPANRVGIILGTGIGGLEIDSESHFRLFEKGPARMPALTIPRMITNEAPGNIAIELGIKGIAHAVTTACSSGTDAIGHACEYLQLGKADVMLTGGSEAAITQFGIAAFCALKALATSYNDRPKLASRPFDKKREGFVMGEGAGILILETLEHAKARGAAILGEICGYGSTTDAFHLTAPDPEGLGAAEAFRLALEDAGWQPEEVDYVNAHGTSTPTNDPVETMAIKRALGDHAQKIKVSSIKGMIGHCLGAAGALEAIATFKAMEEGFYPATINLDDPDPACDLDYVPNKGVQGAFSRSLSSSLGFGGHNGVLALAKAPKE